MLLVAVKFFYNIDSTHLYHQNSTSPFHESKPRYKGNWLGWIADGNTYLSLQAPNKNLCMTSSATTNALRFETCNLVPKFLKLRYNQKVASFIGTKGLENGRENIDTTHPTQLNPSQRESLHGRMGSIHGLQWSSLATPNNEASLRVPIFRWLHSTHVKIVEATSYPQRVEISPYKVEIFFWNMCV